MAQKINTADNDYAAQNGYWGLTEGETVLGLGSFDASLAARIVGPAGRVIAPDISFGEDDLPRIMKKSVDLVVVDLAGEEDGAGLISHSALDEWFRVLKTNGRLALSIAAGSAARDLQGMLREAGFAGINVVPAKDNLTLALEASKPIDYLEIVLGVLPEAEVTDPIAILDVWMSLPDVRIHGPEHHVLDGAALLVALDRWSRQHPDKAGQVRRWRFEQAARLNADEPDEENHVMPALDLGSAVTELIDRAGSYPGGSCGYLGICGSAVSVGTAFSIFSVTTPFSDLTWGQASQLTGSILTRIGSHRGPRCCKRTAYMALQTAGDFLKEHYDIDLNVDRGIRCGYIAENEECLFNDCVYF